MLNLRGLVFDDPSGTTHMKITPITFDCNVNVESEPE